MVINCLHIISTHAVSRVTQTSPRHLPNTFQTPCRHLKYGALLSIQGNYETRTQLIQISLLGVYQLLACHTPQRVSRVTQTTPRHLSDTFQTPYRHPKYGTLLPIQGNQETRTQLSQISLLGVYRLLAHHTPQKVSRVTQTVPRHPQTPSRHLPDTPEYSTF